MMTNQPVENKDKSWPQALTASAWTLGLSLAYAAVRYNVVREIPWSQLPLFIANKAVALTATLIIGFSFLLGPLARFWPRAFASKLALRKPLGLIGFALAALHSLMALALLSPAYYPKFFLQSGKLNSLGESSLVFGILAFLVFSVVAVTSLPSVEARLKPGHWQTIQRLGYLAFFFVLLHVALMGYRGWGRAESYQFGLVSISLIASLFIVLVLLLRLLVALWPKRS